MTYDRAELLIGTEWQSPSGGEQLSVVCPSTEEVVARVPLPTRGDVDRAVAAARDAFANGPWRWLPVEERAQIMLRVADGLEARAEEIAHVCTLQNGQPITITRSSISTYAAIIRNNVQFAREFDFEERRQGFQAEALLVHEPVGVVAAIVPWNGPMFMALIKTVPALLAGCTVILKPAPETPLDTYILAELMIESGLPAGVLSILPAERDVSEYLVGHPGVDKVTFTGSCASGKRVIEASASKIGRVGLELGGKSPAIVLDDVDLAAAMPELLPGMFLNSGQICGIFSRVLVPRSRKDEIEGAIVAGLSAIPMGDPFDEKTMMGPLAAERQRTRVEGYIEQGKAGGATLALGGGRPAALPKGWYVEPTVFTDVDNAMTIAREEIFGPVYSVIPYDSDDDAIRIANDSTFGLNAAIFSPDAERAMRMARRLEVGTVALNRFATDPGVPYGGRKESGFGVEGGREGFEAFLEPKGVFGL
jgi:acyl-CoA reductase-like NAD-dependent aldehyde dehydrogenase